MNPRLLIDAIVRQTTVLIAQLSTAAGIRSPLAHVADEVFLSLSQEIERQGVSRKVVADMFGMALRGYQRKVQRLEESRSEGGKKLWEAILEYIDSHSPTRRDEVIARFQRDDELAVSSVLADLVASGLLFATGRGESVVYRRTNEAERRVLEGDEAIEGLATLLWGMVFHAPGRSTLELVQASRLDEAEVRRALDRTIADGRVTRDDEGDLAPLHASSFVIPEGATQGWEAAVFDHYQALARAVAEKLRLRAAGSPGQDLNGGTTLHFGVFPGHPYETRVLGLLRRFRDELNAFWNEVATYNREQGITEEMSTRVTFYFGQHVPVPAGSEKPSEHATSGGTKR